MAGKNNQAYQVLILDLDNQSFEERAVDRPGIILSREFARLGLKDNQIVLGIRQEGEDEYEQMEPLRVVTEGYRGQMGPGVLVDRLPDVVSALIAASAENPGLASSAVLTSFSDAERMVARLSHGNNSNKGFGLWFMHPESEVYADEDSYPPDGDVRLTPENVGPIVECAKQNGRLDEIYERFPVQDAPPAAHNPVPLDFKP